VEAWWRRSGHQGAIGRAGVMGPGVMVGLEVHKEPAVVSGRLG
jgi:hypothetical protein